MVKWIPPEPGWIKINTDGSFSQLSGLSGGGGIIRNEQGCILEGFAVVFIASSGLDAELQAIIKGIEVARGWGSNIWIETDAQEIVHILNKGSHGAANNRHMITSIRNKLRNVNVRVSHIHREGNMIADYLAKQGSKQEQPLSFNGNSAPSFIKALAVLDQIGMPNFRTNHHNGGT